MSMKCISCVLLHEYSYYIDPTRLFKITLSCLMLYVNLNPSFDYKLTETAIPYVDYPHIPILYPFVCMICLFSL